MKLTGTFIVVEQLRKTTTKFFKDVEIGDVYTLVYEFTGGSGRYGGTPEVKMYQNGKKVYTNSAKIIRNGFKTFAVERID